MSGFSGLSGLPALPTHIWAALLACALCEFAGGFLLLWRISLSRSPSPALWALMPPQMLLTLGGAGSGWLIWQQNLSWLALAPPLALFAGAQLALHRRRADFGSDFGSEGGPPEHSAQASRSQGQRAR